MVEPNVRDEQAVTVKVNGEEAVLHITDQSVMFEKGGKVSGFLRSAIQMIKLDGNAMLIAYSAGTEVKSVRVEPITALAPLLVSAPQAKQANSLVGQPQTSATALDEVFERIYKGAKHELEERLAKIQVEPENKNLRLASDEQKKYHQVWVQMRNIVGAKYGFDPSAEDSRPIMFTGLEKEPYEMQLDFIKTMHIDFLREIVGPKAETADIGYTVEDVWPEDWERVLVRFKLADGPFLSEIFKSYLRSKWTHPRGQRTPTLARL